MHLKRPFDQSQERGLLTSPRLDWSKGIPGVGFRAWAPLRLSARTRAHAALSATRSQKHGASESLGPARQALVLEGHRVTQRALPLLSALDGVPGVATLPVYWTVREDGGAT